MRSQKNWLLWLIKLVEKLFNFSESPISSPENTAVGLNNSGLFQLLTFYYSMNNYLIQIDRTETFIFLQFLSQRVKAEFIASLHVKFPMQTYLEDMNPFVLKSILFFKVNFVSQGQFLCFSRSIFSILCLALIIYYLTKKIILLC